MTRPTEVLVQVADLEVLVDVWRSRGEAWWPQGVMGRFAAAIPEPEWHTMHREELIP